MAAITVEVLIPDHIRNGGPLMRRLADAAEAHGDKVSVRTSFRGTSQCLVLYGAGHPDQAKARKHQLERGCRVIHWDAGYVGRVSKGAGYMRCSIDAMHPQGWLDRSPAESWRWDLHGIPCREDADPKGHILLVGLGSKSRSGSARDWEARKLVELQRRFPKRRIIYRPKPRHDSPALACETDAASPIEKLLKGCALAVCKHSNVGVDAAIAGVPIETEDGAARWLAARPFTSENRLQFLEKLAWWQWKTEEAPKAWRFLRSVAYG